MGHLSKITHPNPNIAEKSNYFCDYFKFVNSRLGEIPEIPFDNPLSIVEKSIYQLDHNDQHCVPYLTNHLSSSVINQIDFLEKFNTGSVVSEQIQEFLALSTAKNKKNWLSDTPSFTINLKKLQTELAVDMVNVAFSSLSTLLCCQHKLKSHKKRIKFYTNILVTEFRFYNHSKKDITAKIAKIMSKDINEFPFPEEITIQKNKPNYDQIRKDYIENRDFITQFKGILNSLFKKKKISYFLFRIHNISSKKFKEFKFKHNKVTFISPHHSDLKTLRAHARKSLGNHFFLKKNDFIVGLVKLDYVSFDLAVKQAKEIIDEELKYLNFNLDSKGFIERKYHIISDDLKYVSNYSWNLLQTDDNRILKEKDLKMLEDNPYLFLTSVPMPAKSPFLYFEPDFQKAAREKNIPLFWQYLESIIPEDKKVMEFVSNILLLQHREMTKNTLRTHFAVLSSPLSVGNFDIGLSFNEQKYLRANLDKINPTKYKSKIKYSFLKDLITLYQTHASQKKLKDVKNYYLGILKEAYEMRNIQVHSGEYPEKLSLKLKLILPILVKRFRLILCQEILNFKEYSFEEIVYKTNEKGLSLIE